MHLFILGATGRTGVYGYKYALEQGFSVTILVRKTHGIEPHARLTIVEGSCLSDEDMQRAFKAAGTTVDAVLVFLNAQRVGQNPWGKFIGPPRLIADSTSNATRALRAQKQQLEGRRPRLVVMNALGSGESYSVTPYLIRFMINYSNVSKSYVDHNAVNDEIEANCGDEVLWTLPLPVGLKESGQKPVKTFDSTESGAGLFITRESCARWMVDVSSGKEGDEFDNKRVIVSN
ncbi:uncharacterized protein PFLUO_LOCUS8515 [Penicillium psychrofluorescens]|uniref:uncharacterized protein n=1 Tax=Penicillium psychrofluorescens TaxID=3158075 RepID=UPI003CCE1C65